MPDTLLSQLRRMTTIVADSGDMEPSLRFKPQDVTTDPFLIAAAARMARYQRLVDQVLVNAKTELGNHASDQGIANLAFRRLAVAFGKKILTMIPGRISTQVDARLSYNTEATLDQARDIIRQYAEVGIARKRVLIKIAATWEGIEAAKQLEAEGTHCNLTLLVGIHQAAACAEAKVTLISPIVGPISDRNKEGTGSGHEGPEDPGVQSVTMMYNYLKQHRYPTLVMGASFHNIEQVVQLAGCDLLTLSPKLLAELDAARGDLTRKLWAQSAKDQPLSLLRLNKAEFERMHRESPTASHLVTQRIEIFSIALKELEAFLAARLSNLG